MKDASDWADLGFFLQELKLRGPLWMSLKASEVVLVEHQRFHVPHLRHFSFVVEILDWSKSSFRFFPPDVMEKVMTLIGQPNIACLQQSALSHGFYKIDRFYLSEQF